MVKYGECIYGTAIYGADELYIFNRTQQDLDNNTSRAYINYPDLNRIESRISELAAELTSAGYYVIIICKTDWVRHSSGISISEIPTLTQLIRIHDNIQELMNKYLVYSTTPKLPQTLEKLTIEGANGIEKILFDIKQIAQSMKIYYRECDTFYCGED